MKLKMLVLLTIPFLFTACNTTAGVGRDLKSAGQEIEKAAETNK